MKPPFFLGIDIGTQGARVVLIDVNGNMIADGEEDFLLTDQSREEQSPGEWWQCCIRLLQKIITDTESVVDIKQVRAVSVCSTSGTVIPLDINNEPLHNAIMYSDKRSAIEADLCRKIALENNSSAYTGFNSSSGLSKMIWFVNNFPARAEKINKWIHAADYITGKLSGKWAVTDFTNALKSGYDLQRNEWPAWLYEKLTLKKEWLPRVVPSGTAIGKLHTTLASQLGLGNNIQVVAGITDGCASQIASGAANPGDWNTTIGTTLVIKGITKHEIKDPEDRLYSHRHPEGYWMPGGAGNIGADWVTSDFKDDLVLLSEQAKQLIPSGKIAYPLRQQGERFPFIAIDAKGFEEDGLSRLERFTASMEGVAYVERYAYEMIEKLSGEKVKAVYTAGGGSNSHVWLTIRSNVLNFPIYKMKYVTGAMGAAIVAASKTHFENIIAATLALTQIETQVQPQNELVEKYNKSYPQFLLALQQRGYLKSEEYA